MKFAGDISACFDAVVLSLMLLWYTFKLRWWTTEAGKNLFAECVVVWGIFIYAILVIINVITGDSQTVVRFVVFAALGLVFAHRLFIIWKGQRNGRKPNNH